MASLRRLGRLCRDLAKQHVDDTDVPAAPDGADGYAEWVQIAVILFRVDLEKSLRETEDYLNEMPGVLAAFNLDEAPHYGSLCRWEQQYRMRELRRLLRRSAEQAGWSGEPAIDASGFQRDQTSYHYRDRANYSLQSLKTTILIDVNSLAIKDVHITTRRRRFGTATTGCRSATGTRKTCVCCLLTQTTRGATSVTSVAPSQRVR